MANLNPNPLIGSGCAKSRAEAGSQTMEKGEISIVRYVRNTISTISYMLYVSTLFQLLISLVMSRLVRLNKARTQGSAPAKESQARQDATLHNKTKCRPARLCPQSILCETPCASITRSAARLRFLRHSRTWLDPTSCFRRAIIAFQLNSASPSLVVNVWTCIRARCAAIRALLRVLRHHRRCCHVSLVRRWRVRIDEIHVWRETSIVRNMRTAVHSCNAVLHRKVEIRHRWRRKLATSLRVRHLHVLHARCAISNRNTILR